MSSKQFGMTLLSWRNAPTLRPADKLYPWLTDEGSLTARIRARCQHFEIVRLSQGLTRPLHDEAQLAGVTGHARAWVREVLLIADHVPVVYARSVVGRASIRGAWEMFAGLGTRSLGTALFSDPLIARGPLQYRSFDVRDTRYRRAISFALPTTDENANILWARRSRFERKQRGLIVCEFFLPAILDLPTHPIKKT